MQKALQLKLYDERLIWQAGLRRTCKRFWVDNSMIFIRPEAIGVVLKITSLNRLSNCLWATVAIGRLSSIVVIAALFNVLLLLMPS